MSTTDVSNPLTQEQKADWVAALRLALKLLNTATMRGTEAAEAIERLEAENARLRGALTIIDALDPEEAVYSVTHDSCRGLLIEMGRTARAALNGEAQ